MESNEVSSNESLELVVGGARTSSNTKNKTLEILKYVGIGLSAMAGLGVAVGVGIYGVNKYNDWKEKKEIDNLVITRSEQNPGYFRKELPAISNETARYKLEALGNSGNPQAKARLQTFTSQTTFSDADKKWIMDQEREQMKILPQYVGSENVYYATDRQGIQRAIDTTFTRDKTETGTAFEVSPLAKKYSVGRTFSVWRKKW